MRKEFHLISVPGLIQEKRLQTNLEHGAHFNRNSSIECNVSGFQHFLGDALLCENNISKLHRLPSIVVLHCALKRKVYFVTSRASYLCNKLISQKFHNMRNTVNNNHV